MGSDNAINRRDAAVTTKGQGTGRTVLINTSIRSGVQLAEVRPTSSQLVEMIADFEVAMYCAIKRLLKRRRGDFIIDRGNRADENQPFYFTGQWASGSAVKHGERRFLFDIANAGVLRAAAGLSGGGPRSPDYLTLPNESFLAMAWDEKQSLIDRALGPNWRTLQAAINASAYDFGIVLPDLRGMLADAHKAPIFLKRIFTEARPEKIPGEIRRGQQKYLFWCFLAYLRQRGVLLLPLCSYYVQFWGQAHTRFDNEVVFSISQRHMLDRLWRRVEKYDDQNRVRIMRIAQTLFLAADIQNPGDISLDAITALTEALLEGTGASPSYREKFRDLARAAYDCLLGFWNDDNPRQQIMLPAGAGFRQTASRVKPVASSSRRRVDPFWFAEVPDDEWHPSHPIPGYTPKDAVRTWAAILRETFPHIKVKDPVRFRVAGVHWLSYINGLDTPPSRLDEVIRSRHINDLASRTESTFRHWLTVSNLSPGTRNDVLSGVGHMFDIYIRLHGANVRNPIEFDLDRFLAPAPRGKTPRTPLSPEMLLFLKDFNSRDDFAFSRGLKPHSWTTEKSILLRHYRRLIDPDDGEEKIIWWPGLAVLLDVMLTIPLRGFQARWLDTGEGDEFLVDPHSLQETPNPLPSAQKGRQMGVFTSFPKGINTNERLLGLIVTTNKRTIECDGRYGIPWCPDDLRDNIAMLLAWQRRYNPITSPVRAERDVWTTHLRSEEVSALIPLVFPLFRDPGSEHGSSPPTYQQIQTYWNQLCAAAEDELHVSRKTSFRLTRDRTRKNGNTMVTERVALFDLHTLRVSGITALIEAGLPPHFVQEIVGHAAVVMTLYYHKLHPGQVNQAMADALESHELSLERIPEILNDLDSYDSFLLNTRASEDAVGREMIRSAIGNGTYQILSHGICPGGDCRTGGEFSHPEKGHQAVSRAGACSMCRYRVTGPMFLAGLVVNANKIMSELYTKGQEIARLNDEVRVRRREDKPVMAFESRREVLHRELEDLWLEWAAEHQYVEDSARMLAEYLNQQGRDGRPLPVLAANGAIAQLAVKSEHRHPFHLNQLLAEASAYVPSERHTGTIGLRDTFLNELLANNRIDPFLLRLDADTRLHAGNMLGRLLADMVPDADLQAVHDGTLSVSHFIGLQEAIRELAATKLNSTNILQSAWGQPAPALWKTDE